MEHLSNLEEKRFQEWYRQWVIRLWERGQQLNPNPDDPRHQYDYRKAYLLDLKPEWTPEHQQYRWPDTGKQPGYIEKPSSKPGEIQGPEEGSMANGKEEIAHGGVCPPGQIYDHNKSSPSYGQCIDIVAYKETNAKKGLEWMKNNEPRQV